MCVFRRNLPVSAYFFKIILTFVHGTLLLNSRWNNNRWRVYGVRGY